MILGENNLMKIFTMKLLILIFLMDSNLVHSQITIQGTITDVSSNPVSGALVEIINEQDTTQVNSNYTENNGSYTISISPTDMKDNSATIPNDHIVLRNYPNPFNPSTIIYFEIPNASEVDISIFDILGREIKTLPTKFYHAGIGRVTWDATNNQGRPTSAGIYLCRLKTAQHNQVHKMILVDGGNITSDRRNTSIKHSLPKMTLLQRNSFQFTLRISGESISQLKLKNLSCDSDTTINVQVGRKNRNTIGVNGGSISMINGFNLIFQEGAFDEEVTVEVAEVPVTAMPDTFLSDVTQISNVISINTGGVTPNKSAIVSFPITPEYEQYADSTLAIYQWDGNEWLFAGGYIQDNVIYTYVRNFSLFFVGNESMYSKVYRLFHFMNTGFDDAMVYVSQYQLLHPEWDVPITEDYGTPCFTQAFEPPIGGNLGWYPQGWYQFCAEWYDEIYGVRHRILGNDPPNWSYSLSANTSLIAPPVVYVNASIAGSLEGPCKCEIHDVVLPPPSIYGTWENGPYSIYISAKNWIFNWSIYNNTTDFPVVILNEDEQYVIVWDNDNKEYIKFAWEVISENQIKLLFYMPHSTVEEAINDNESTARMNGLTRVTGT
jgi:hypothetical protein